jgi:hypothetical protein
LEVDASLSELHRAVVGLFFSFLWRRRGRGRRWRDCDTSLSNLLSIRRRAVAPLTDGTSPSVRGRRLTPHPGRVAAMERALRCFFSFRSFVLSSSVAPFAWLNFLFFFLCRGLFAIVFCGVGVGRHVLDATLESGEKKTKKDSVRRKKKIRLTTWFADQVRSRYHVPRRSWGLIAKRKRRTKNNTAARQHGSTHGRLK